MESIMEKVDSQETVVSKLRNILTPHTTLPQVVRMFLTEHSDNPELKQIILELCQQASNNHSDIHDLLTQLAEIENKHQ